MEKKVLILTYQDDPHASSVRNYLNQREVENFTIVTENLLRDYKINFSSEDLTYRIGYKGKIIELTPF